MKINNIILTLIVIIFVQSVKAQKTMNLILIRGKASLKYLNSKDSVSLESYKIATIDANSVLYLSPHSEVIAYSSKKMIALGEKGKIRFTINNINTNLYGSSNSSISSNFISYLGKLYDKYKEHINSKGRTYGGVSRGIGDTIFLPFSSSIILEDSVILRWDESSAKLQSNLLVINVTTNDTIYNSKPLENNILLKGLSPGTYNWIGNFQTLTSPNLSNIIITFSVPKETIRKKLVI